MFSKLKKCWIITILIAASLLLVNQDKAFANQRIGNGLYIKNNVSVVLNGEKVTFKDPILNKNGQLFLPMRDFYEMIDASVYWNQKTKTASAERNGKMVEVTLNSKRAKLNGSDVTVNVPPFLYKYKTYVPIRFLSENLGGDVTWNQQAQKVEISLGDDGQTSNPTPPPVIKDPYTLHINDKRIVMEDPIVTRNGRSYIPAEYFHQNLENSSGKWLSSNEYELQISGLIFVFTNGSKTIRVNEESVETGEQPFIQSRKMYVPVKFIINAMGEGGNLRYLSKQKEMYIYLYQYMFTSKFLEKSYGSTKVPQNIPNAELSGERTLLVSDNPETLTAKVVPNSTATLSAQNVRSDKALNEHRVFGWHYNTLGKNIALGITIENTSATDLQVAKSEGVFKRSGHSWINYDIGLPIADQVLNNQLTKAESEGITIAPGETKLIQMYTLHNSYIIGLLHDFDIQPVNGGESSYTIRTVLAKNGEDLTTIHSDPVPINPYAAHPRGVWPSSAIVAEFPTYTIGDAQAGYSISNGKTDHFFTEESSLEQLNGAVGNSGHFGLNYIVKMPVANPSGQPKNVKIKLSGRGGLYSGAIKINGQVHLIPTLKPGKEYIELPVYTVNGSNEVITLEVMHAGGSNLPLAIYIETE